MYGCCRVEAERAERRRVVPRIAVGALRRAGLSGDRQHVHRVILEKRLARGGVVEVRRIRHARIALAVRVGHASQPADDRVADLGRHLQLILVARSVERLQHRSLGEIGHPRAEVGHQRSEDRLDHRRLEEEAAVRQRRVRIGQLQRRRRHEALTDRGLHVVADEETGGFVLAEDVVLHQLRLDGIVGNPALPLERQLHARVLTEPEALEIVLQRRLALQRGIDERVVLVDLPELLAEAIEVRVATDSERVGDCHRSVRRRPVGAHVAGVLELATHAGRAEFFRRSTRARNCPCRRTLVGPDHAAVHRRPRDEWLDRRAQVVATLDRAIDQDRFVGVGLAGCRVDLLAEQLVELVAGDVAHPAVVEPRIAGHRQDLAVGVVLHHHRAGRSLVLDPLLVAVLLRACVHALRAAGDLRIDRVVGSDVLAGDVGRQVAPLEELGLQGLLGILLHVEVDRQLDVHAGDRVHVLVDQLANDAAGSVDLEDFLAPRAVQRVLHRLLDAERADQFVGVVVQVFVVLLGFLGDRAEVADDVAGERRIRIDALPLLDDLDAGEVFAALLQVGDGVFVDTFLQRKWQQCAEALTLRALRDGRFAEARFVPTLQVDDRHLQRARQSVEERVAILLLLDRAPVDRDREDALVVGHDPTLGIEDASALGRDQHFAELGCRDALLVRRGLDTLQEPQSGAECTDQQRRDQRQHPEAGGALIDRHDDILVRARRGVGSPSAAGRWWAMVNSDSFWNCSPCTSLGAAAPSSQWDHQWAQQN